MVCVCVHLQQEGAVCAGISSGGVAMVQPLLVQYVVFPYEDGEEQQCRTEMWVEPQCGRVCQCPPALKYLDNLTHTSISNVVSVLFSTIFIT